MANDGPLSICRNKSHLPYLLQQLRPTHHAPPSGRYDARTVGVLRNWTDHELATRVRNYLTTIARHALIETEKKWYFPPNHAKRLCWGDEMAHEPIEFRINTERLMRGGDRVVKSSTPTKDLQPGQLRAEERLYLSLLDTPGLDTTGFLQNKNLIRPGEHFTVAYMIVSGEVLVNHEEKTYKLGAGAVIGLSEGIVGMPSKYSATTNTFVEMKIIPFQKVVSTIKTLPPELQAIILNIVQRNLQFY